MPKCDECDSPHFGKARAAPEHFKLLMEQHHCGLVSVVDLIVMRQDMAADASQA